MLCGTDTSIGTRTGTRVLDPDPHRSTLILVFKLLLNFEEKVS
jgi:hypothetical protein